MKAHPPLRWVGGKTQLLDQIRPLLPKTFNRYFEPFVGGGAVFFDLEPERAILSDLNAELVDCYQAIKDCVGDVIRELKRLPINEKTYYAVRSLRPAGLSLASGAARTIYLNKTCFTPGSMVLTENEEYVAIETVTVGQRLWGGKQVQEVISQQYKGTVLRIRLQSNPFTLSVTEDHPVLTITGKPKEKKSDHRTVRELAEAMDLKPARDLRVGDYVLLPTTGTKESPVDWAQFWPADDTVGPQAQEAVLDTTDEKGLCRLLGYYAAQGSTGYQYGRVSRVDFAFNSEKEGDIRDTMALCEKLFGRTPNLYRAKGKRLVIVQLCSVYASRFIHALVPGQSWAKDPAKRKTKRLHSVLMHMPVSLQLELLRGWFRGDGGLAFNEKTKSCTLAGTCTVPPMARQMYRLAQRCGFRPSWWVIYPKTKSHPEGDATCQVGLCIVDEVERLIGKTLPARRGKCNAHRRFVDGYIAVRIKEVTQLEYDGTVHNLEVDGDHLLCVDGVVSHNCFNGLHRVNKSGGFNVPWGRWKPDHLPTTCDEENLRAVSAALRNVDIRCADFANTMLMAQEDDFCYCDSPYVPLTKTANFTAYTPGGFGLDDLNRLRDAYAQAARRGVHVVLSNADTPLVREMFKDFVIHSVSARRSVNSDASRRGKVGEVVVTSYEVTL